MTPDRETFIYMVVLGLLVAIAVAMLVYSLYFLPQISVISSDDLSGRLIIPKALAVGIA